MRTLEAEVCRIADTVAYINHDIDDAIRAGTIDNDDLPSLPVNVLGNTRRERINTMVNDIIVQSWSVRDPDARSPSVTMSPGIIEVTEILSDFLWERVYNLIADREETEKARETIRLLYHYFNGNEDKLPPEYSVYSDEVERRVVDYIAGMTDQYATRLAEDLYKRHV